ncbi:holo-ACP synthase [Niallia sp. FSL W8-0635]|uniref:holo-ACP synthase n=1 Tax=Niallia sp. FSL W8-0635 TaxID=2975337 RepID=UPI0009D42927|nr:Holo-[acyl-carrier-protein] synthase [Mycobacteroides abscessus subsp. abscessus]HEO8420245.1 holo-ACP synthase [Yersinia enterocolitica]
MIKGTGIDITEIERIETLVQRKPNFAKRILTDKELEKYQKLAGHRKSEFLAGRFAAKEAFSKALGTGIGAKLSFLDIEIGYEEEGKPCILKPFSQGVHLSITHSKQYAFAQVIIEG